jgi:hypothetical protein
LGYLGAAAPIAEFIEASDSRLLCLHAIVVEGVGLALRSDDSVIMPWKGSTRSTDLVRVPRYK